MRLFTRNCYLMSILAASGFSQTFEVATVKLLPAGERRERKIETTPGNVVMKSMALGPLIGWAYKISAAQVSNPQMVSGPESYDIIAKASGPAKVDDMRIMMRALLAERFQMVSHHETKEMTVYAIVEARGGHKLRETALPDGAGIIPIEGNRVALKAVCATIDQLGMFLGGPLRAPVVDETGLKGRYDFEFDITNFVRTEPVPGEPPPDPVSVLQAALPAQLGLKLTAKKMPIEVLVIDKIQKTPTDN